uniref:Uncharacterized protein n=1 Tax=Podarcis muralis TaxID=64176 RepID=A0A670HKK1_PODMU
MERQEIMADFKQLHQFLEEQEHLLLSQLKELDNEIKNCRNQYIAKLCEEMASLDNLIRQLEEKQKQPVTEFLQNMRSILERCNENKNKTINAIAFPRGLKQQIDYFSKIHPFLEKETKKFKDAVLSGPQENKGEDMAIPKLVLEAYGQAPTRDIYMKPPSFAFGFSTSYHSLTPLNQSFVDPVYSNKNINCCSYVMGVERITSGTHSWADEMADEGPVQNLCEETTCSICLEYFTDPVIIDCGHNFCQTCITEAWRNSDQDASCPQCREPCQQRNFRPNRQLANIVEIAKKFSLQMARGAEALGKVCERHQEPLKLFCEDDQDPICVVCDKSKEHRDHKVIPKEEAFEEYQGKILRHLEFLNKQREEILSSKLNGETESQNLLKQTDMERQEIMADFKQLHQFLEEQERLLLAQLKELDDEIKSCEDQHIAKLSEEMASIDDLIKELEKKQKQPATEFLQVRVGTMK